MELCCRRTNDFLIGILGMSYNLLDNVYIKCKQDMSSEIIIPQKALFKNIPVECLALFASDMD